MPVDQAGSKFGGAMQRYSFLFVTDACLSFLRPGGGEVGVAILHGLDARHPSSIKRKKTKSQLVGRWLVIG